MRNKQSRNTCNDNSIDSKKFFLLDSKVQLMHDRAIFACSHFSGAPIAKDNEMMVRRGKICKFNTLCWATAAPIKTAWVAPTAHPVKLSAKMSWSLLGIARIDRKRFSGRLACLSNIKWYDMYAHDIAWCYDIYDDVIRSWCDMYGDADHDMNSEESCPVDSLWWYVNMFPSCFYSKCKESEEPLYACNLSNLPQPSLASNMMPLMNFHLSRAARRPVGWDHIFSHQPWNLWTTFDMKRIELWAPLFCFIPERTARILDILPFHRRFWPSPFARVSWVSWVTSTATGHHGHLRWSDSIGGGLGMSGHVTGYRALGMYRTFWRKVDGNIRPCSKV